MWNFRDGLLVDSRRQIRDDGAEGLGDAAGGFEHDRKIVGPELVERDAGGVSRHVDRRAHRARGGSADSAVRPLW